MLYKEAFKFILAQVGDLLNTIDDESIRKSIEMMLNSKKIFIYGAGRSGIIGKSFAMRLVQLGLTAYFIGETITPIVTNEDSVVLISNTGTTKSTLLVAEICKNVGARVIVITSNEGSPLVRYADEKILLKRYTHNSLAPLGTIFEDSTLLLLDSLIAQMMQILNQTEEDLKKRHAIWV
ncbi:MAG: SIS domain-containing protein [Thermoplasmata archaeon]|jgi:6-phospho-3-hexuloisomerase|nr:SIS domain-containing protein [Thermoplasmatales archaeon]PMP73442.1 MAG: iron dicitrate transport regulator FecR [Aciduliprofundum sp.]HEU12590.1 SIS domain-containing protein [Euryarchaeota archaeon]